MPSNMLQRAHKRSRIQVRIQEHIAKINLRAYHAQRMLCQPKPGQVLARLDIQAILGGAIPLPIARWRAQSKPPIGAYKLP